MTRPHGQLIRSSSSILQVLRLPVLGKPLALELCSGSAGVSLELGKLGWAAVAVDRKVKVRSDEFVLITADLRHKTVQKDLLRIARHPDLRYVHVAPPCGTASRARDKLVRPHVQREDLPDPPQLRSDAFPMGLPNLNTRHPKLYLPVVAANEVYIFAAEFCATLTSLGISWTLENPARSYFWEVPVIKNLLGDAVGDVLLDLCMFGSKRMKHTRLRSYPHGEVC